jgi:hypothetical protein
MTTFVMKPPYPINDQSPRSVFFTKSTYEHHIHIPGCLMMKDNAMFQVRYLQIKHLLLYHFDKVFVTNDHKVFVNNDNGPYSKHSICFITYE